MSPDAYLEMARTEDRHWWFAGRRAILKSIIFSLGLSPNAHILEIGSGTGGNLEMLSGFGKVSGLEMDATARAIAAEKTGGRFDIRDGCCPSLIPFGDVKFDLICLFDVLEHIKEDEETLLALKGLLAKGGRVLLTVPAYDFLLGVHDAFLYHERRYSSAALRQKAVAAGFQVVKLSHFNAFLFPVACAMRLKDRLLKSPVSSGTRIPPPPSNSIFRSLFSSERFLLRKCNLPFGMSLLAVLSQEPPVGKSTGIESIAG